MAVQAALPSKPRPARASVGVRARRYVERRCKEGLTKTEAIRCLKRYVAGEVFHYLDPLKAA